MTDAPLDESLRPVDLQVRNSTIFCCVRDCLSTSLRVLHISMTRYNYPSSSLRASSILASRPPSTFARGGISGGRWTCKEDTGVYGRDWGDNVTEANSTISGRLQPTDQLPWLLGLLSSRRGHWGSNDLSGGGRGWLRTGNGEGYQLLRRNA
ncbi:hypothetical protein BD779DRAFT_211997 [Infundibulicybe gibba]|nr:hypothetical protein BD779DRAFT_211997 [Infundibulicybe gibba]